MKRPRNMLVVDGAPKNGRTRKNNWKESTVKKKPSRRMRGGSLSRIHTVGKKGRPQRKGGGGCSRDGGIASRLKNTTITITYRRARGEDPTIAGMSALCWRRNSLSHA